MNNSVIDKIIEKAKTIDGAIVLPESYDIRVIRAVKEILTNKISKIILIGKEELRDKLKLEGIEVDKYSTELSIIDIDNSEKYELYSQRLFELRQSKGMSEQEAHQLCKMPMYFATMMVKLGDASGVVAGATWPTADTLRPALQIVKAAKDEPIVSSFFLMNIPNSKYQTSYIFADCGTIPTPTSDELAHIAIQSAKTYKLLVEGVPNVAMLSYSTYGSAKSDSVTKVQDAVQKAHDIDKQLNIDGELQLDAAIVPEVGERKAPNSSVAGKANVLIFPNIDAGNIGYKLVERFAQADAIGPITQGMAAPINDLSRGCKAEDIVVAVAITKVQAFQVKGE